MGASGSHREQADWARSAQVAADLYRLAERVGSARLADQLTRLAALLPARIAEGAGAERLLLEIDALLEIAVRLDVLTRADLNTQRAALDGLRGPAAAASDPPARPAAPPARPAAPAPAPRSAAPRAAPAAAPPPESGTDRLMVDGSNFLGRAPGYMLGDEESRDRLLLRLQEYGKAHPAHRLAAFFDGQRVARRQVAGVEEHVTGAGRPADDVIVDYLRALPAADHPRTTLVTDDRELAQRARAVGVRVEAVAWLVERLQRRQPAPGQRPGLSKGEVSEWEQFFKQPPKRPGR